MTNLKLFGLQLDESGSNISTFQSLFSDETGIKFRRAIAQAFRLANGVVSIAREEEPSHKLALWDQAVKWQLERIVREAEPCFVKDTRLLLEGRSKEVWKYGIHIFESSNDSRKRFWNLPDGLVQTSNSNIALELDHGNSIGKWATQLIKATRSAASSKINGVLFCFCFDNFTQSLFSGQKFTAEFQTLVESGCQKQVGIITIDQVELSDFAQPTLPELANFLCEVYHSVEPAQRLAAKIELKMG